MKRLVLILLFASTSVHAGESRTKTNRLLFDPTPIESDSKLVPAARIGNPKKVKPYMIVNGIWMAPVDN